MRGKLWVLVATFLFLFLSSALPAKVSAQKAKTLATPTPVILPTPTIEPTETPVAKVDITQKTEESVGPLEKLLREQKLGPVWPYNFLKYAIRNSVSAGVPANTIVLICCLCCYGADFRNNYFYCDDCFFHPFQNDYPPS